MNCPLGCTPNRRGPALALVVGQEYSSNQNIDYCTDFDHYLYCSGEAGFSCGVCGQQFGEVRNFKFDK